MVGAAPGRPRADDEVDEAAPVCGDGRVEGREDCDLGARNDDNGACTASCRDAACGDGHLWIGVEGCDEGADNDDAGACTSACREATCGDGLVHAGVEGCDDGPANDDAAACTSACQPAVCSDGHVWLGVEECDDGNTASFDGCSRCREPVRLELADADATLLAEAEGDWAGASVAGAGDLNGDGYDDVIVGASYQDEGGLSAGMAYVVHGPIAGIVNLAGAEARLVGEEASDRAGSSVAGAGDVNADGVPDLIVGAPSYYAPGAAYVVYGPVSGTVDLAGAGGKLEAEGSYDSAGASVAGVGDVDGDGFDDLLVGAPWNGEAGPEAGAAYLVAGPVFGTVHLGDARAKLRAEASWSGAGDSVAGGGDVDGDGVPDLLVGAGSAGAGGAAYVVLGPASGSVDLGTAPTSISPARAARSSCPSASRRRTRTETDSTTCWSARARTPWSGRTPGPSTCSWLFLGGGL